MLIRDIIAHLRHGDCSGRAVRWRLTGIEGVSNRPVGVEAPRLPCRCCGYDRSCSFAGLAAEFDGSKIASALGKSGTAMPGGVYRVGLPRTDLHVTLDGVELKAGFALGSWLAFRADGNATMVMAISC